ncbi:uncharacterized protein LOC114263596 isoform X5 [Camellia sinensis]|uniref:uncharacterized protein LOC114263596 isoform X5 n=1 Tax=Camellia sinensis TaxID=4442 RepID=UPI0010358FE1|nr:uncharacterized protein LOC114263596 isoform X5 [Camellia sinensis]
MNPEPKVKYGERPAIGNRRTTDERRQVTKILGSGLGSDSKIRYPKSNPVMESFHAEDCASTIAILSIPLLHSIITANRSQLCTHFCLSKKTKCHVLSPG